MPNEKGAILTITIIFIIILTIIAGVSIILMTNHSRITESQIKRAKAYYTAEAGITHAMEQIRNKSNPTGPWILSLNGLTANVTSITDSSNKKKLKASVKY